MSNAIGGKPVDRSTPTAPVAPAKQASLESLTSRYVAEQHGTYLRLLQEAVQNKRNLNIALTGRQITGSRSRKRISLQPPSRPPRPTVPQLCSTR